MTWHSSDGLKCARDDYIAIPTTWSGFHIHSSIDTDLDSGTQGLDHSAVQLHVRGALHGDFRTRRSTTFDRQAIRTATQEDWKDFFADWPEISWSTDVTTHAALVESEFQQRLQKHFPPKARKRNRPQAFTDQTWDLFQERNYLKKVLAGHHRAVRHLQYHSAWISLAPKAYGLNTWISWWSYALKISSTWRRLQHCSRALKRSIQCDRADYIRAMLRDVATTDHRDVMRQLKPLRLGRRVACKTGRNRKMATTLWRYGGWYLHYM